MLGSADARRLFFPETVQMTMSGTGPSSSFDSVGTGGEQHDGKKKQKGTSATSSSSSSSSSVKGKQGRRKTRRTTELVQHHKD